MNKDEDAPAQSNPSSSKQRSVVTCYTELRLLLLAWAADICVIVYYTGAESFKNDLPSFYANILVRIILMLVPYFPE
jgi:hypothetical protein